MPKLTAIRKQALDDIMKEAIFEATVAVLGQHGVEGMTMDRVATAAGVRRISAGPAFFRHAYGTAEMSVKAWLDGDFAPSFANGLDYARMNALFS